MTIKVHPAAVHERALTEGQRDDMPSLSTSRRGLWVASLTKNEIRVLRHIGLRVRAARLSCKLTRSELAVASGLNAAHIGTIERGENNTTLLSLIRLASALKLEPEELLIRIR